MQCHIFTPGGIKGFSLELQQKLASQFDVTYYGDPKHVSKVASVQGDKVVALDPDLLDWTFDASQIDGLGPVKALILPTTSFSWIDTAHARQKGIPVTNVPNYCTNSVAEYAVMMAFNLARRMPLVAQAGYKQDLGLHQGIDLHGRKVGIVGLGHIGTRIAELCQGLGMDVTYYSRKSRDPRFRSVELEELFRSCDVVFPTLAKNEQTKTLITNEMLLSMKPDALFVSIVHEVYDHELLIRRVQEGRLFGYGFEQLNASPLDHKANILALPTLAWATRESIANNLRLWVEAMILAKDGQFSNRVN